MTAQAWLCCWTATCERPTRNQPWSSATPPWPTSTRSWRVALFVRQLSAGGSKVLFNLKKEGKWEVLIVAFFFLLCVYSFLKHNFCSSTFLQRFYLFLYFYYYCYFLLLLSCLVLFLSCAIWSRLIVSIFWMFFILIFKLTNFISLLFHYLIKT